MSLCLIPARGGSKRIPRKNIRDFAGRPMIGWSIAAALATGCFERVIVSTDDAEIADVARGLGADVPFTRPAALSNDHATTLEVVQHAMGWLTARGEGPAALCCLYATAPFVQTEDLRTGRALLAEADFAVPVTTFAFPIQRAVRIVGERLEMLDPTQRNTRSQDLELAWHDCGQFYWGRAEAWAEGRPIFGGGTAPIRLPRWRVQDIDTEEDWQRAEAMFHVLGLGNV